MISINPFTQNPWIAEQSSQANNGQVAALDPSAGGTVVPSTPTTAPSGGAPVVLTPATPPPATVSPKTVTPVTTPMFGAPNGQFTEYPFGNSQPNDVIVDSSGNTWVIESGTNKIARITAITPDFGLSAPSGTVSIAEGSSGSVTITGTSITGYSGAVTLAVTSSPPGVSFSSFTPNPINIPSGGTASAALVISVAAGAPVGPTRHHDIRNRWFHNSQHYLHTFSYASGRFLAILERWSAHHRCWQFDDEHSNHNISWRVQLCSEPKYRSVTSWNSRFIFPSSCYATSWRYCNFDRNSKR